MASARSGQMGLHLLGAAVPRGLLGAVLILSLAGSLTEGFGLMLLVPMLGLIGAGGIGPAGGKVQQVWQYLVSAGLPTGLGGLLALFVAMITLRAALVSTRIYAEQALKLRTIGNLRLALLGDVFEAHWSWLAREPQARLLNLLLGTIDRVGMSLQQAQMLVAALATLIAMLAAALLIDPLPALTLAVGGALAGTLHVLLRRRARHDGEALQRSQAEILGFFSERLALLRLVKILAAESRDLVAAGKTVDGARRAQLAYYAGLTLGQFALQTGIAVVLGLTVWLAARQWHSTPATLLPLIAVSARSAPLLVALQAGFQNIVHDWPALVGLGDFARAARAAAEPGAGSLPSPRLRGELVLERVTVRHPERDRPALDAVSLRLAAGSTTMLSGPSGAGKSTLADVLAGLVAPGSGAMRIDGVAVTAPLRRAWRGQVAYVQQEPVLLHASIRDNLLWACPDAAPDRIVQALRDAAADFVFALPAGLETVVGDRGAQLSGGERQRIALARGLLRQPDLLILDEVTSALDPASEAGVVRAVADLRGRMTIVIVSHRGAFAALADREIRLRNGTIVTTCDTPGP